MILAITGASGGPYARRLLDCLESAGIEVHLIISAHGQRLLADECDIREINVDAILGRSSGRVIIHDDDDLGALPASGSYPTSGMVICPCSSNTLGAIASGRGDNLVTRAAAVTLKEARRLVIVHREMPINAIDVENFLRLQRAGAIVCPAAPGFYHRPQTVADLVDFLVARILDLLDVPHRLNARWQGSSGSGHARTDPNEASPS